MTTVAGIDIGSATTKAVVLNNRKILAHEIIATRAHSRNAATICLDAALDKAGLTRQGLQRIVATGYGRVKADFADKVVTEITCHGYGAKWLYPEIQCVIDIGGQDSKVIVVNENGGIEDFVMNDKCAAGTGRFIELIAHSLDMHLSEVGPFSLKSKKPVEISSMCAVFAESEVVSMIADGIAPADILAGIHRAVARRVASMSGRIIMKGKQIALAGGVAKNIGMVKALQNELGRTLVIPREPQIVGALGAAVLAQNSRAQT